MRCESYTIEELGRLLVERGFDGELASAITGELSASDFARFSTANSGPVEMRAALGRVRELAGAIDRARLPGATTDDKEAA